MRLSELKTNQKATIVQVHRLTTDKTEKDTIATRLNSLGFVAGEPIQIITKSFFGGDPVVVKIGFARFALRLNEAERIEVNI